MGHGTTDVAAFGGKSVALNALSQGEYQELTTMSIASFQIIKTLMIIIIIIIIMIIIIKIIITITIIIIVKFF